MINLQSIKGKNFLSYGNTLTTFNFEKGVNRIVGVNGSGKSTFPTDLLWFLLFGKPYRKIKVSQLINSINKKDLYGELLFTKGEDVFRIERGLKPDIFKIFKNDEIVPVSSSKRGYQEILEENILGINENLFNQIGVKSLTKNLSFMTLDKAAKRSVIENIFDVELFSTILKNVKENLKGIEFDLKTIQKDIDNTELLIEQEIINIDNLNKIKKDLETESEKKLELLNAELTTIEEENKTYVIGLDKINNKKVIKQSKNAEIKEKKEKIKLIQEKQMTVKSKIKLSENKIAFLSKTCSGCPKIQELLVSDNTDDLKEKVELCESAMVDINKFISEKEAEIEKLDKIISNERYVNDSIFRNDNRVIEINKIIKSEQTKKIVIDKTKLKTYNKNIKELQNNYIVKGKLKKHYTILKGLYSEEGIKAFIIKKYLPAINKLLNSYLHKFNSDIIFNFDAEFNEVVKTRHKENFSYFNFSEGQKSRINLAILFAFINFSIYKNKKSNINVLVLDEISSGLDIDGRECLMKVLQEFKEQHNKSVIMIDNSGEIEQEYLNKVFETTIEKGFSVIKEINH